MPESTVRTERLLESLTNMHHVFRCLPPTGVINKGEFYVLQHQFSHIIEIQCLDDAFTRQPILKSCCQHFDPRTV